MKSARHSIMPSPSLQRGVGLIEVLISVLVLSIGLLGIAALQAQALKNGQSSLERSQAVILTYSILDAMRADPAGDYATGGFLCQAPGDGSLRDVHLSDWIGQLQANLGEDACGQIAAIAGPGRCFAVSVRWNDARATQGSEAQVITTRSCL